MQFWVVAASLFILPPGLHEKDGGVVQALSPGNVQLVTQAHRDASQQVYEHGSSSNSFDERHDDEEYSVEDDDESPSSHSEPYEDGENSNDGENGGYKWIPNTVSNWIPKKLRWWDDGYDNFSAMRKNRKKESTWYDWQHPQKRRTMHPVGVVLLVFVAAFITMKTWNRNRNINSAWYHSTEAGNPA